MEELKLVKKDDRCFVNPLFDSPVEKNPLNEEFKAKVKKCALKLLHQWEKTIKKQFDESGRWSKCCVYTGIGGYAMLYLELGILQENEDYVQQAFFLAEKCSMHLSGTKIAFLTGDGGPLAIAAVASRVMKQHEKEEIFVHKLERLYSNPDMFGSTMSMSDELLYGKVGCLYSLLYVQQNGGMIRQNLVSLIANSVVTAGIRFAQECKIKDPSTPPLMYEWHDKKYLGAAHGLAGILYILLNVKEHLSPEILNDYIRPTLDYLLLVRLPSGNYPSSLSNETDRLVQWCHGAPGFVHCFVKASQVFQSDVYMRAALDCGDIIWERGVLTKGLGLCHGISGNAFCFLHLYQSTGDPVHLHRACQFARIILDAPPHECRTPDHPYSLFEGSAGIILFLFSLLYPESSRLPGYQV